MRSLVESRAVPAAKPASGPVGVPPPEPASGRAASDLQGASPAAEALPAPGTLLDANVPPLVKAPAPRRGVRCAVIVIGAAGMLAAGWAGWEYWTSWRFFVSTDDAYVQADIVTIAAEVDGTIVTVAVGDNQPVSAGDLLATIDPRDYQAAVDNAQADVDEARANIVTATAEVAAQQAAVDQAKADRDGDTAKAKFAQESADRTGTLAKKGWSSTMDAQSTAADLAAAQATVASDGAALEAAQQRIPVLKGQIQGAKAALEAAEAELEQAGVNLTRTRLTAPVDGIVAERTVRVGQYVQPGTQLLALVPVRQVYVVANYKETQLTDVTPGQPASVTVDTFPGTRLLGWVDSLSPASGEEFALLPPDNATGNFTKIVQRIAVKIALPGDNPLAGRLRPGMSVTATIDIRPDLPAAASPANPATAPQDGRTHRPAHRSAGR